MFVLGVRIDVGDWLGLDGPRLWQAMLWSSLGVVSLAAVFVLFRRRRSLTSLHKCTIFSVWFHALLVVYATSVQIVAERPGPGGSGGEPATVVVRPVDAAELNATNDAKPLKQLSPRDRVPEFDPTIPRPKSFLTRKPTKASSATVQTPKTPPTGVVAATVSPRVAAETNSAPSPEQMPTPKPSVKSSTSTPDVVPESARRSLDAALTQWNPPASPLVASSFDRPITIAPSINPTGPPPSAATSVAAAPTASQTLTSTNALSSVTTANSPTPQSPVALPPNEPPAPISHDIQAFDVPPIYQQRVAADRERIAAAHGGSARTEAAVKRALAWLAFNQEVDGRWDPDRHGAGREMQVLGKDRGGAGANADTGITGLALLALLGSGHTHLRGDYRNSVGRALDYLATAQHPDGNLGGRAEPYAFMYCHGMATLALSEALAMSGDARLKPIVERAIGYTLRAQNRVTGGWRYRPGDTGDTSQLGWQLMSLKSAELAGIEFPQSTRDGILRFVGSVSSGRSGGQASYRPGERVSCPMTAEALLCRQFLGTPRTAAALDEAGDLLLTELPGTGQANFYYWYYGTLSMYQLQGEHWKRWNDALTTQLLAAQQTTGDLAGSWDPNDVWGGYGGRVYSTALATLCLEVYYRYLPLYVEAAQNGDAVRRK